MKVFKTIQPMLLATIALMGMITLTNCNRDDDDDDASGPTAAFTYTIEGQTANFTFTGSNATS
jgi:hypothetical protein